MKENQPIEYTGNVLDKRNTLTGPDDPGRTSYPKRPKHVLINNQANKTGK